MKTVAALCIMSASVAGIKLGEDEVEQTFWEHYMDFGSWSSVQSLTTLGGKYIKEEDVPFDAPDATFSRNVEKIYSESCDLVVYWPSDGEIVRFDYRYGFGFVTVYDSNWKQTAKWAPELVKYGEGEDDFVNFECEPNYSQH